MEAFAHYGVWPGLCFSVAERSDKIFSQRTRERERTNEYEKKKVNIR